MDIFRHRPLFLWCVGFMGASVGGFFLFRASLPGEISAGSALLAALALIVAILGITLGILLSRHRTRQAITLLLCGLLMAAALGQSYITFAGRGPARLRALTYETIPVRATVTERRGAGGYLSTYAVELEQVDGSAAEGRSLLVCHYPAGLSPGDAIELDATLIPLDEAAGDGYDATALQGDGYVIGLLSEAESDIILVEDSEPTWQITATRVRLTLAARLDLMTEGADGLPAALLLGDKSALDPAIRRDFARAGVSHLLAISGLHMTLLFGLLEGFLRLLRCPKRWRAVLLSLSATGYLVLLGFPPSATRAVIMLGAVYLSRLLAVRADSLTSLGLAGALILVVTPYAVADAGFWMSFLATLGLVALTPPLHAWVTRRTALCSGLPPRRVLLLRLRAGLLKLLLSLAVGVIAMTFTLFITAAVIGEMGVLSPVTTVLLAPLCCLLLPLSLAALPFFGTGIGHMLGRLAVTVSGWMRAIAETAAKPPWAVVSLMHEAVLPLAFLMMVALLVLFAVCLPRRRQWMVVLPILVGWLSVGGVLAVDAVVHDGELGGTFLQPSSQADMLVLVEGRDAMICDMSNGSLTSLSTAAREASRRGATEIAVLMLTHYHSRTSGALADFLATETVRALWLPTPENRTEYFRLLAYLERAELAEVPVFLYERGEDLTVFSDATLTMWDSFIERSVQPVLLLSLDTGAKTTVYCGSSIFESALADKAAERIAEADTVIFGNHGPLPKAHYGADLAFREDLLLIFSGEGDTMGYFDPSALPQRVRLWRGQMRFPCS